MSDRDELFSMVQECTNSYRFIRDYNERESKVEILIPKRFSDIWMSKLSDLQTSLREIEENE
jgi:hypothetical protein